MQKLPLLLLTLICTLLQWPATPLHAADTAAKPAVETEDALIKLVKAPFKGDLDEIRKRRMLRVLVTYSRTRFFYDGGHARGFEPELLRAYEKILNKGLRPDQRIKLFFIPVPFGNLLGDLQAGRGDIAAAGLTATHARKKQVAFTRPYLPDVSEVVVHHKKVAGLKSIDSLSDRTIFIRKNSSYVSHLKTLNARFKGRNIAPCRIEEAPEHIVTEDILDLVNAGIVPVTVVDHHIAAAWQQAMENIVVRQDLVVHSGGDIAWAVRKKNQKLRDHLNAFIAGHMKGSLLGNILYNRYFLNASGVRNPMAAKEREKLMALLDLFKKYGDRYDFDFMAIAAQAYQESRLEQSKRSPTGAMGIMQVLPSTAADKKINIKNIEKLENNIHAGVKYLHFLRKRYFSDPAITPANQVYFSWAAYNAGPAKISRIRRQASKEGFDPNRWFSHVENIAAKVIGRETVTYVANINKYYVAYQLQFTLGVKRQQEVETLQKKLMPADGKE